MLCRHQDCQRNASGTYMTRSGSFAGRAQRIWRAHCLQYHDKAILSQHLKRRRHRKPNVRGCVGCVATLATQDVPALRLPSILHLSDHVPVGSVASLGTPDAHAQRTDDRAPPSIHLSEPFFCPLLSLKPIFPSPLISFRFHFLFSCTGYFKSHQTYKTVSQPTLL